MNILMIGNSYTVDASRYLHRIARADGVKLTTVCLYIGGCPLERHFRNMHTEANAYELYINGEASGFSVSLKEALLNRSWDAITFQQASHFSFDYATYQPYLNELMAYAKKLCPKAKHVIHQTWSDAEGSQRFAQFGFADTKAMFADVEKAYAAAAENTGADMVVCSGKLILSLYEKGLSPVWRDSGHVSFGIGRFALGLLWYRMLTGNDIMNNSFADLDEPVSAEEITEVKKCVCEIAGEGEEKTPGI